MADDKNKNVSIFQGVKDAIDGNKKRTPDIAGTTNHFTPRTDGMIEKDTNQIENIQQQFLNWQATKVAHNLYQRSIYFDTDRIGAYQDYRAMDMSPEIAAALDIIRDECLTRNAQGHVLEIYSENSRVKEVLRDLFLKRLNIEFNLKLWIRDLVKYGDYFVLLYIDKEDGIYNYMTLPVEEIHREEGYNGKPENVRFRWETTNDYFEDWQIAHFRLLEDTKKLPYGRSILDPARKLWKQLQLAEDSMLVYRITRAPERRVFYVEVGNLEEADVQQYIKKIQNQIQKQPIVDSMTGNINLKYNPMNITEDYYIPIRGDKSSKIDTLPGATNLSDIEDIIYLEKKLFASLKVPKAYLNYVDELPGGNLLSQADIRFSRTINTLQELVLLEMRRIANIHLYFRGFVDDIDNFTLSLTNPSTQQELLKLETMKARNEVAKDLYTGDANSFFSWTWVHQNIYGTSNADIKLILKQKKVEKKIFAEIDSSVETYRKIGLFKDIDAKYELPPDQQLKQAPGEEKGQEEAGGGGGGGGFDLGGFGGGPEAGGPEGEAGAGIGGPEGALGGEAGGGAPAGGGGPGGAPAGAAGGPGAGGAGAGAAGPLGEVRKLKQVLKESDVRFDEYLDELIQEEKQDEKPEESSLLKSNNVTNFRTKKLLETMGKALEAAKGKEEKDVKSTLLREVKKNNSLLDSSNTIITHVNETMAKLDKLFGESEETQAIPTGAGETGGQNEFKGAEHGGGVETSGSGPGGDVPDEHGSGNKSDDQSAGEGEWYKHGGPGGADKGGSPDYIQEIELDNPEDHEV